MRGERGLGIGDQGLGRGLGQSTISGRGEYGGTWGLRARGEGGVAVVVGRGAGSEES
jgi:hypothetical protein